MSLGPHDLADESIGGQDRHVLLDPVLRPFVDEDRPLVVGRHATDHLGRDVFSRVVAGDRDIFLLAGSGTLVAVVGLPVAQVYGPIRRRLEWSAFGAAAACLALFVLAWLGAERLGLPPPEERSRGAGVLGGGRRGGADPGPPSRRRRSASTQLPRVPALIPRSRATCRIGLPVSRTSRTAAPRKSLSNFLRVSPIGGPPSKRISPRWEGKPNSQMLAALRVLTGRAC